MNVLLNIGLRKAFKEDRKGVGHRMSEKSFDIDFITLKAKQQFAKLLESFLHLRLDVFSEDRKLQGIVEGDPVSFRDDPDQVISDEFDFGGAIGYIVRRWVSVF